MARTATWCLLCLVACVRTSAVNDKDVVVPPPFDASIAMPTSGATSVPAANPLVGEWERRTEPYLGMRIAFRDDGATGVVTTAPPLTPERLASQSRSAPAALAKAQLECQRSLWKAGDALVTNARATSATAYEATILVRDWGFTGTCRHADSHAPARITVQSERELTIDVTRGKTVTQKWARVGP